ncbi:hypothetical protein ScPMuIL_008808 [Solemya velum]
MTTCRSSECTSTPTPAITIYNSVGNKSLETCTIVFLTGDPSTSETLCKADLSKTWRNGFPQKHLGAVIGRSVRRFVFSLQSGIMARDVDGRAIISLRYSSIRKRSPSHRTQRQHCGKWTCNGSR